MKKTKLIILIVFTVLSASTAQQKGIDSLLSILSTIKNEDSTKAKILSDISFAFRTSNPAKGIQMGKDALTLSIKIGSRKQQAYSLNSIGANYLALGNPDSALESFKRSISVYKEINDKNGLSVVYGNKGSVYLMASVYDSALFFYNYSLTLAKELGNEKQAAAASGNVGIIYIALADYPQAIRFLLEALRIHEKLKSEAGIANVCLSLGMTYRNLLELNKAMIYTERSIGLTSKSGDKQTYATALGCLAQIYFDKNDFRKSIETSMKSIYVNNNLFPRAQALAYAMLGKAYSKNGQNIEANENLDRALDIFRKINDVNNLCITMQEKGIILMEDKKKLSPENIKKAISLQEQSLEIAKQIGSIDRQATALENLSKIYRVTKNFEKSLAYYSDARALNDSIYSSQKKDAITRMDMQFDFDKKEALAKVENDRRQAFANAEINRQKYHSNLILLSSAFILLAGAGGFISYKRNRDAAQKQNETATMLRIKDTELKALRLQMNPHFIDNALQSIQHFMKEHKAEEAEEYLVKFSSLMRSMLINSERDEIPLSKELETLEWYMQLENLRMNYPFTYKFYLDESVDTENTTVPPNILQPFVENAIKHGLLPKAAPGNITVYVTKKENELHVMVEDDGVGRDNNGHFRQTAFFKRESLGIKITEERLHILNRLRNVNAAFKIVDLTENNIASGTRVELSLPFQQ